MEQTSVCLICLVGLPASGKSTIARNIEARYKLNYNVDIVCFDDEIDWEDPVSWKNKRGRVHTLVKDRIERYLTYLNRNTLLILDDNMFYRSMRFEYYQLARKYGIGFCEIYLSTPINQCLKMNRQRDNPVAEITIVNMNANLEPPDFHLNKWEKNSLTFTQILSANDWLNFEKLIYNCLQFPERLVEKTQKETNSQSALHLADIALRKLVSSLIKEKKEIYGNSKYYCLELAKKRHQILESVRNGEVILPEINNEENGVLLYSEFLKPFLLEIIKNI